MRGALALAALMSAACTERAPALIINITSSLAIPTETNSLAVRIVTGDGAFAERTYPLGEPPRDLWPQVLPILTGERTVNPVRIEAELRNSRPGSPSVAVGYGTLDAMLPASGETRVDLDIPRQCEDRDRDGYGIGFGCLLPDCDDTRSDVPDPVFCPGRPQPDAGMTDSEPSDAELSDGADAETDEAGPPIDTGVPPEPPDAGPTIGRPCSSGGLQCSSPEVCFSGICRRPCMSREDCPGIAEGCLPPGVCICGVPCENDNDCGPLRCVDGCCDF